MFSATMPGRMERLARDALTSPLRISVGEIGAANEDIKQVCYTGLSTPAKPSVHCCRSRPPTRARSGMVAIIAWPG